MCKYLSICNIYIFLWCLYSLQGTLYATGSIISQGLLGLFLLLSVYYVLYTNVVYKFPPYMKALNVLLAMFTIYGVILLFSNEVLLITSEGADAVSNKDYLKNIYMSLLPIYAFFAFGKKRLLTEHGIQRWIPIFILITIARFFAVQQELLSEAEEMMSMRDEFTNNTGYIFLAIVPLLMFIKKPIWQYMLLLVCGTFIIAAMKRGAIIICAISLVLFFYYTLKGASLKRKVLTSVLVIGSVVAIVYYVSYMLDTSDYFNARLEQTLTGRASNREDMYPHLLRQIIYFATPLQFLFGRGAYGTLKVSNNLAHNDWLEIGINQGILGVAVYVAYWIAFYVTAKRMQNHRIIHEALILTMLIFFIKTMFSMSYDSMPIYASLCIGYCMANYTSEDTRYEESNMLYR